MTNSKRNTASPQDHAAEPGMFDIVMTALEATGRIPHLPPQTGLPAHFSRDNVSGLYLEKHAGGWVANLAFRHVPPGLPDTLGTPDAQPFPCEQSAFLAGAALLCHVVTGSHELPFTVVGNRLLVCA